MSLLKTLQRNVSKLFDHAAHNGSNYLNGHCFVSVMLCVPVWNHDKASYLSVPLGYRMWQKKESNLDLIGNARADSVMYDLEPARTGHRGRPAKHGKRLSVETDFTFSNEKIGDYYTGVRRVLTRIFGTREVLTYVTAAEKEHGTKRLFFSTVFPEDLQIFCAWQEKVPLNQTGSDRMKYIPLFLYSFRWNIETSYYEQKYHKSRTSSMKEMPENVKNLSPDTSVQTLETLCNLYKFSHYHCYFLVKRVYFKALNTRSTKL